MNTLGRYFFSCSALLMLSQASYGVENLFEFAQNLYEHGQMPDLNNDISPSQIQTWTCVLNSSSLLGRPCKVVSVDRGYGGQPENLTHYLAFFYHADPIERSDE